MWGELRIQGKKSGSVLPSFISTYWTILFVRLLNKGEADDLGKKGAGLGVKFAANGLLTYCLITYYLSFNTYLLCWILFRDTAMAAHPERDSKASDKV